MRRSVRLLASAIVPTLTTVILGCSGVGSQGSQGEQGSQGPAGAQGSQGSRGSQGASGPQSLSGVVPHTGLLARDIDVLILGSGTSFDQTSTVTFGSGVTVSNLSLVSPSALSAHLQIAPGAPVGPSAVSVTTGTTVLVAQDGFSVAAPIDATVLAGVPLQGGVVQIDVDDQDQEAFSTSSMAMIGYVSSLGAVAAQTAGRASFYAFIDPLAPIGNTQLEVANVGLSLDGAIVFPETFLSSSSAISVAANPPRLLTAGAGLSSEWIDEQFGTRLYKTPTAAAGLLTIAVAPTPNSQLAPRLGVYPTSGRSADFIGASSGSAASVSYPVLDPSTTYSVVSDASYGGGSSQYGYGITAGFVGTDVLERETTSLHFNAGSAQNICAALATSGSRLCLLAGNLGAATMPDAYVLPGQDMTVYLWSAFDTQAWLTRDPTFVRVDADLSPVWPAHLAVQTVTGSAPWYLVVQGRTGGSASTGSYTVAASVSASAPPPVN